MASTIQNQASPTTSFCLPEEQAQLDGVREEYAEVSRAADQILPQGREVLGGRDYMLDIETSEWREGRQDRPFIECFACAEGRSWSEVADKLEALVAVIRKHS